MSAFAAIQAALMAALSAAPALAEGRVYADRSRPLAATYDSAISVRMEASNATSATTKTLDWTTAYSIECYARATADLSRGEAVDALLSAVWLRLSALDLRALGVASIILQPNIDWQYDDADSLMAVAVINLQIQHRTPFAALTPWA